MDLPTQSEKSYRLYAQPPAFGRELKIDLVEGGQTVASTKAEFTVHDPSQLVVGIGSVTPADIQVAVLDNLVNTNEVTLGFALPTLIALVLPDLGSSLGAFPIPSFFGLQLEGVEVSRSGQFYSLFTNLNPAP